MPAVAAAAPPAPPDPVAVLVPGGPQDFWGWTLGPRTMPEGLHATVRFAGWSETATREALLESMVAGTAADLVLLRPQDVPPLADAGLLADLADEPAVAQVRTHAGAGVVSCIADGDAVWGIAAGLTLPLVLIRPEHATGLPIPDTWAAFFARLPSPARDNGVALDPGQLELTFDWLRRRAQLRLDATGMDAPAAWGACLTLLRRLHSTPSATRFWQKRWSPAVPTFRRGRAAVAIADTEALRDTTPGITGTHAMPLPAIGAGGDRYPVAVAGVWVVPAGTDVTRVRPLLAFVTSAAFAARLAQHHGWAPVRTDAWDLMGALLERIPAWQTVQRLLQGAVRTEAEGPGVDARRVRMARAAGLWLSGVHPDPAAAWRAAQAAEWQAAPPLPQPFLRIASASMKASTSTEVPRTLAQGETALLELAAPPPKSLAGAGEVVVYARVNGRAIPLPAQLAFVTGERDALRPAGVGQTAAPPTARYFVDVHVPFGTPLGRYDLTLAPGGDTGGSSDGMPIGSVRVTAIPTDERTVPALCGLGLPAGSPYTDAVRTLLLDHGFTPFPLPLDAPLVADPRRGPLVLRRWHDPTQAERDAHAAGEAGVLADVLEYSYDEPTLLHFPHLRHEAARYQALGVRVLATHPPDPLLAGTAQVWGVHTALRPTHTPSTPDAWRTVVRRMADARARGEDVWWYTAGDVAPLPSLQLHANLTRLRAAFFRLPALGFSGVLQPEAAAWGPDPGELDRGALGVGEGILCFPARDGSAVVRPSVRLKALREGRWTLHLLAQLHRQLAARTAALPDGAAWTAYPAERLAAYGRAVVRPEALALGDAVHPLMHLTTDPRHLATVARALRLELEGAFRGPWLLVRADVPDWSVTTADRVTLSGRVPAQGTVSVAGRRVVTTANGNFTVTPMLDLGLTLLDIEVRSGGKAHRMTWHVWRAAGPLSGA